MYVNVDAYCDIRYNLRGSPPTASQRATANWMARTGRVPAIKSGRKWLFRLEEGNGEEKNDAPQ